MRPIFARVLLMLAAAAATAATTHVQAQTSAAPANPQVIEPQVDRRDVRVPKFPSKDFEVGLYLGSYSTENFGASRVAGLRLGYHVSEDIFVEAAVARTQVSDDNYRQILPGGLFPDGTEPLTYYNLSVGYNLLPGEVFPTRKSAWSSALYLIGGVGSTSFLEQRRQTINLGLGLRVFLRDWAAIQVDVRDHIFSLDLLGKRQNTQNIELTTGLTIFF